MLTFPHNKFKNWNKFHVKKKVCLDIIKFFLFPRNSRGKILCCYFTFLNNFFREISCKWCVHAATEWIDERTLDSCKILFGGLFTVSHVTSSCCCNCVYIHEKLQNKKKEEEQHTTTAATLYRTKFPFSDFD